jgi:hypothetical protein
MNPPPAPAPFLIVIAVIVILFIVIMAFRFARRTPASKNKFRDARRNASTTIEPASFEAKVIMMLQKTGCRGKPNDKGLIEVYKKNKLVGIVKCCEDSWEVTPALINELAKLRVGYQVEIAYIATSGTLPSMAMSEAKYHKIRILKIEAEAS